MKNLTQLEYQLNKLSQRELIDWIPGRFNPQVFETLVIDGVRSRNGAKTILEKYIHEINMRMYSVHGEIRKSISGCATLEGFPHYTHWHLVIGRPFQADLRPPKATKAFWREYEAARWTALDRVPLLQQDHVENLFCESPKERRENQKRVVSYALKRAWKEEEYACYELFGIPSSAGSK